MGVRILIGKIIQLLFGAAIGVLLGGIITGNENYWIGLVVGLPILITFGTILGAASAARQKKAAPESGVRPGIISSIPGMKIAKPQTEAVLNPVSTAQPSAGMVLNGQVVGGGDAPAKVPPASTGPKRPGNPWWWNVLSIITIAVGAALVLLPSAQLISWVVTDIGQGRPFDGRDMTVGLHQQEAFDAAAERIGGTQVVEIDFFPSYINVSAPTTPGARTVDRFRWEAGYTTNEGPDYTQPDDLRAELFDAGDIDMSVVAKVVRQSIAEADLQGLDGVYPRIARSFDGDPQISISLSGDYFDAYFTYTLNGELIDKSGTAFED